MAVVSQFTDAKLSPEHWEEIGREIKQPHSKLRSDPGPQKTLSLYYYFQGTSLDGSQLQKR